MRYKVLLSAFIFVFSFIAQTTNMHAQVFIDMEAGMVYTGYNTVRIPGNTGTLFSLKSHIEAIPVSCVRARVGYTVNNRHTFSLLFAPLRVRSRGTVPMVINFEGFTIPAGTRVNASYTFNSYRFTYRYDFIKRPKFELGIGFTGKVRDARIEFTNLGGQVFKENVGFVPIINFRANWILTNRFGIVLEGDALAAKQGRAEDVLLAGTYNFSEDFVLRAGYRVLEGGADNSEVYNFALFHYAIMGCVYFF